MATRRQMRVSTLAGELSVSDREVIQVAAQHGMALAFFSRLDESQAALIRTLFGADPADDPWDEVSESLESHGHDLRTTAARPRRGAWSVVDHSDASFWEADDEPPIDAHDEIPAEGPASTGHLIIDTPDNHLDNLRRDIARLRERFGDGFLPNADPDDDLLDEVLEIFFPVGLTQQVLIANTSNKLGGYHLSVRVHPPTPRLLEALPAGVSLCFQGFGGSESRPSNRLTLRRIVPISDSDARPFERGLEVVSFRASSARHMYSDRSAALTPYFLATLPAISLQTREKLQDWLGYLSWKERMVRARLVGVRYVARQVESNGGIRFVGVAESQKRLDEAVGRAGRDGLEAFGTGYSNDDWLFDHNDRHRGRGRELGDHKRSSTRLTADDLDLVPDTPWDAPAVQGLRFEPTDDALDALDNAGDDDEARHKVLDAILASIPEEGWLATSAIGDMALIRRQRDSLREFEEQGGYAPFLSSYIFDISLARPATRVEDIEVWLRDDLNENQKSAVAAMLQVPDVGLLQGPPGTGKTTVIAEAAFQFARRGQRVLIVSQANLAVDNALQRLADNPEIRAIRLGKPAKVSNDLPFHQDNVLGWFYTTVAGACRSRTLDLWAKGDREIQDMRQWLDRARLLSGDVAKLTEELKLRDLQEARVNSKLRQQEEVLEAARAVDQQAERLRGYLQWHDGGQWPEPWMPGELLDLFEQEVVRPLRRFETLGVEPASAWDGCVSGSEERRTGAMLQVIEDWKHLQGATPQIEDDLRLLASGEGEDITDSRVERQLRALALEKQVVIQKLATDSSVLGRFQEISVEERSLRAASGGLDEGRYRRLFSGRRDSAQAIDDLVGQAATRNKASDLLGVFVVCMTDIAPQVAAGLDRVRGAVNAYLKRSTVKPDERSVATLRSELRSHRVRTAEVEDQRRALFERVRTLVAATPPAALEGPQVNPEQSLDAPIRTVQERLAEAERAEVSRRAERALLEPLLKDWVGRLEDPETARFDAELVLEDYIAGCNVVGVTCTERNDTLTRAGQPYFDVVIIDEVSKATPCEMMMPLMLGRRAMLVGDHRQLPPLFKERTDASWEETLNAAEEQGEDAGELTQANFDRYKHMVTASLFKEHFEKADASIKTSLWTQYRMHPQIMSVINHFYDQRLVCGLDDPDGDVADSDPRGHRRHGLTLAGTDDIAYLTPDRHVLWIDSSSDASNQPFFETQSGTSKENALEAALVAQILADLDRGLQKQGYGGKRRKEVGVISFYGRQVGAIRRAIERYKKHHHTDFPAIQTRISTVDRFQGQEQPIIIASLVRNTKSARVASSSHVAAFERINVAMSRAQELLVIVGAKQMFHGIEVRLPNLDRPGHVSRRVYRDIIDEINRDGGFQTAKRVLTKEQQQRLLGSDQPTDSRQPRDGKQWKRHRPTPGTFDFAAITVSQEFDGVVEGTQDYGAFINIGGTTGLLHRSRMNLGPAQSVGDSYRRGTSVRVRVVTVDVAGKKIGLALARPASAGKRKPPTRDGWEDAERRFPVGSVHDARVENIAAFGLFVRVDGGPVGLVHSSKRLRPSQPRAEQPGDRLRVQVETLDLEQLRLGLLEQPTTDGKG